MITHIVACLTLLLAQAPGRIADSEYESFFNPRNFLSETELNALMERIFFARERFYGSWGHRSKEFQSSLGHFLTDEEYRKLTGNPVVGYYHSGSFVWSPEWKDVHIEPFASTTPDTQVVKPQAWRAAAAKVCGLHGLTQSKSAKIRVTGRLVGINLEPPYGVYLEARVHSPTGTLLYRGGIGKATLADSIGASLDHLIAYARSLDGRPVTKEQATELLRNIEKKAGGD